MKMPWGPYGGQAIETIADLPYLRRLLRHTKQPSYLVAVARQVAKLELEWEQ